MGISKIKKSEIFVWLGKNKSFFCNVNDKTLIKLCQVTMQNSSLIGKIMSEDKLFFSFIRKMKQSEYCC